MTDEPDYFTPAELAAKMRLSPRTLALWRAQRTGPTYTKFGSRVLYPRDAFVEWERAYRVGCYQPAT